MHTILNTILRHKIIIVFIFGTFVVAGVATKALLLPKADSTNTKTDQTAQTQPGSTASTTGATNTSAASGGSSATPAATGTSTSSSPKTSTSSTGSSTTTTPTTTTTTPNPTTPTSPSQPTPPQATYCGVYPAVPNSSCTGWRHTGVTLRSVPEQVTSGAGWSWEGAPFNYIKITGDNAVLDSLDVHGCVYIDNTVGVQTVTVKRSRVTGSCDYLFRLGDFNMSVNLQLQDVELVGSAVQMKGSGFSWVRVDSYAFTGKGAMMGSNTLIQDSYIHDNVCNPPDHQSGIGTNGGASNIQMIHNNVDLTPSDCTSGGIANYDDFGAFSNVLIQNNLMNSAGYCLKAGFEQGAASGSGMRVIDNTFGRKYFPECGYWGAVSNWLVGSGNVWSGNVWGSGAAATAAHALGSPVLP